MDHAENNKKKTWSFLEFFIFYHHFGYSLLAMWNGAWTQNYGWLKISKEPY